MGRIKREEIHRDPLDYKPEGVARLLFKSFGGMAPWNPRNEKIVQKRNFARNIEEDM